VANDKRRRFRDAVEFTGGFIEDHTVFNEPYILEF
jgi:hypothetical protein